MDTTGFGCTDFARIKRQHCPSRSLLDGAYFARHRIGTEPIRQNHRPLTAHWFDALVLPCCGGRTGRIIGEDWRFG